MKRMIVPLRLLPRIVTSSPTIRENPFILLGGKSPCERTVSCPGTQLNYSIQGRVVRKAVNANPGLKVNRGSNFSRMKMYSTADVLCSLTLLKLKTKQYKQKTFLKSYKTEIKILANPGLA